MSIFADMDVDKLYVMWRDVRAARDEMWKLKSFQTGNWKTQHHIQMWFEKKPRKTSFEELGLWFDRLDQMLYELLMSKITEPNFRDLVQMVMNEE
jgi:hypothetical protein